MDFELHGNPSVCSISLPEDAPWRVFQILDQPCAVGTAHNALASNLHRFSFLLHKRQFIQIFQSFILFILELLVQFNLKGCRSKTRRHILPDWDDGAVGRESGSREVKFPCGTQTASTWTNKPTMEQMSVAMSSSASVLPFSTMTCHPSFAHNPLQKK